MLERKVACLSLWQPWASLLMDGIKRHETRGWAPPLSLIGHVIVIHAAKRRVKASGISRELAELLEERKLYLEAFPRGVALGAVMLQDVYPTNPCWADTEDLICGNWGPGRFAWKFSGPRIMFKPHIPLRGRQKIFYVDKALFRGQPHTANWWPGS